MVEMLLSVREARHWSRQGQLVEARKLAADPIRMPGHVPRHRIFTAALWHAHEYSQIPANFQAQGAPSGGTQNFDGWQ